MDMRDSSQPQAFLGIDVAKEKVDGFLLRDQQSSYRVFPNELSGFKQLSSWLHQEQSQRVHVCLEATGCYSDAIAQFLFEQGHIVSLLNPAVLVDYRKSRNTRSKTDRLDARLLAYYGQQLRPPAWHPLPENILVLRSLLAYRD